MKCCKCGNEIGEERLQALIELNINYKTCIKCAPNTKIQAQYLGQSGISPMIFVNKVDNNPFKLDELEEDKETDFIKNHPEILENID